MHMGIDKSRSLLYTLPKKNSGRIKDLNVKNFRQKFMQYHMNLGRGRI